MPDRQEAVIFGGIDAAGQALGDTWTWHAGCWSQQAPGLSPSARDSGAAVYDPIHHVVLMYGGRGDLQFHSDTWAWNGQTWTQVSSSAPALMFAGPVAGFDPVSRRPILFGIVSGGNPETWSWDGSAWKNMSPSHSPIGRLSPSMALDASRGQLMLFGGINTYLEQRQLNDTWAWDGTDWIQLRPTNSPPARFRATMGSLTARHLVILWGGVTGGVAGDVVASDAWKFDGATWSQITSPGVRADEAAIDIGSRVLFFGGDGPDGSHNDLFAFDGTKWTAQ
ncbi:MAG TPA: hypothetical protein VF383_14580 [Candidatus Dormibacteraeota bacterium]